MVAKLLTGIVGTAKFEVAQRFGATFAEFKPLVPAKLKSPVECPQSSDQRL